MPEPRPDVDRLRRRLEQLKKHAAAPWLIAACREQLEAIEADEEADRRRELAQRQRAAVLRQHERELGQLRFLEERVSRGYATMGERREYAALQKALAHVLNGTTGADSPPAVTAPPDSGGPPGRCEETEESEVPEGRADLPAPSSNLSDQGDPLTTDSSEPSVPVNTDYRADVAFHRAGQPKPPRVHTTPLRERSASPRGRLGADFRRRFGL